MHHAFLSFAAACSSSTACASIATAMRASIARIDSLAQVDASMPASVQAALTLCKKPVRRKFLQVEKAFSGIEKTGAAWPN